MKSWEAVAVCGRTYSGKSALVRFLAEFHGFAVVSFGVCIRRQVARLGLPETRRVLQDTGYELFRTMGPAGLLHFALESAEVPDDGRLVFDGVRDKSILTEIRRLSQKLCVVYVSASEAVRYDRYRLRGEDGLSASLEKLREIDQHPIERGIEELATEADLTLDTSTLSPKLQDRLLEFLRTKGMLTCARS